MAKSVSSGPALADGRRVHLGMYEDKLRIGGLEGGLEGELAEMTDEELEREITETSP